MQNIQQITPMLYVANLDEARYFFETVLGFSIPFSREEYLYCERDGVGLRVIEEKERKPIEKLHARTTVYCDCHDVDSLYNEMQNQFYSLPSENVIPPQDYPWQQRELWIQMPDGNMLAFGQPIQRTT